MSINVEGDGPIRRAVENLIEAYRLLNDPSRDRDLYDALEFARAVVAKTDGEEVAVEWLNRQAALIRSEARDWP